MPPITTFSRDCSFDCLKCDHLDECEQELTEKEEADERREQARHGYSMYHINASGKRIRK